MRRFIGREEIGTVRRQQIQIDGLARAPIGRDLQDRRPRQSPMREQRRFREARFAKGGNGLCADAAQGRHPGEVVLLEGEGHKARPWSDDGNVELLRDVEGKISRPDFLDRQSTRCDDQFMRVVASAIGIHRKAVRLCDFPDMALRQHAYACRLAFIQEHTHNALRRARALAEQLAQRLFVMFDAVLVDQRNEVGGRVAAQR